MQELSKDTEVLAICDTQQQDKGIFLEAHVEDIQLIFLVDTGRSVSLLQEDIFQRHFAEQFSLVLPPSSLVDYLKRKIPVKGCFQAYVQYQGRSRYVLFFVVEKRTTLLALNAIKALNINIEGRTLQCYETSSTMGRLPESLVQDYAELFSGQLGLAKGYRHMVTVRPDVQPVCAKLWRIPLAVRDLVSQELRWLETEDILERVEASEWVCPIVVVHKEDGEIRLCVDLQEVNEAIIIDTFPLPHTEELLNAMCGAQYFSRLNLASAAYPQVLLHLESRNLTAFITQEGLYRFKRVCLGFASSPAMFQRMMSALLKDCPGVLCYIDDIIVFGRSQEEHTGNL